MATVLPARELPIFSNLKHSFTNNKTPQGIDFLEALLLLYSCVFCFPSRFFLPYCFAQVYIIYDLCGKGELCDNVLFLGIAEEGVVLGGDIHAVKGLDVAPIVFYVQAV